jgi:hypothetical protein
VGNQRRELTTPCGPGAGCEEPRRQVPRGAEGSASRKV